MQELVNRAKELLANGTVARVLGWKVGDLCYNPEPAFFTQQKNLIILYITVFVAQTLAST